MYKRKKTREEVVTKNHLMEKLRFYKKVKSQVVVDYFGNGDVYIPTFSNYNGGRILLGNVFDENFDEKRRGLTMKILKNLQTCSETGILFPRKGKDGCAYASNSFSIVGLMSIRAFHLDKREEREDKFRVKRLLKKAKFRGTAYPYSDMMLGRLEVEAKRIAQAVGEEV